MSLLTTDKHICLHSWPFTKQNEREGACVSISKNSCEMNWNSPYSYSSNSKQEHRRIDAFGSFDDVAYILNLQILLPTWLQSRYCLTQSKNQLIREWDTRLIMHDWKWASEIPELKGTETELTQKPLNSASCLTSRDFECVLVCTVMQLPITKGRHKWRMSYYQLPPTWAYCPEE
jgi:hypothetical protein